MLLSENLLPRKKKKKETFSSHYSEKVKVRAKKLVLISCSLVSAPQGYLEAAEHSGVRPVDFHDEMGFINTIEYALVQRKIKGRETALEGGKVDMFLCIVNKT